MSTDTWRALNVHAKELGERAMMQAQLHAEQVDPGFTGRAASFVLEYLRENGRTAGETLTDLAIAAGHVPPDARAFGAVFRVLVKRGKIRHVGWCERRKGHGSGGGRVWEAA